MSLDRIQEKVFAGEPLSEDELTQLKRAAQNEGGPALRTLVAQALINAEAPREALPLLDAVCRDFPTDVQAHLARGRALVSLERWAEAERAVREALRVNPGDPEALKVLAVVALRRGEWARARAMVDEVLEVDPLDTEAQALSMELEQTAQKDLTGRPSRAAFIRALTARLDAQSTPHLVQKRQLLMRVGKGGVLRLDLDTLYADFAESDGALEPAVAAIARELCERTLGLPRGRLHLMAKALPVLREAGFVDKAQGMARREGPAGLWIYYALQDDEVVRYVPEAVLPAFKVTLEELDAAASRNLEQQPAEVRPIALEDGSLTLVSEPTQGLWTLARGDGHDAARLLLPTHLAALEAKAGPGPFRVYLGLRELVLVCREADEAAVERLTGLSPARDGIGGVFRLRGGRLEAGDEWPDSVL